MRVVFIGASATTLATGRMLSQAGHEVVVIEKDRERAEGVAQAIDCGCLHGDGSKPALLREADPEHTELLYCLTENDQANILAALVGRSLGFRRVVCKVQDPELIHVCVELGLEDVIVPSQTTGRFLAQMLEQRDPWELSGMIRGDARLFSFVVKDAHGLTAASLKLPRGTRVVCYYRADAFHVPDDDTRYAAGDEIVLITRSGQLAQLVERWGAPGGRR